ncbi:MAG: hypothetical protein IPK50_15390 [Fibrobacterota bacterium]|nr:hypothetical protein [Fibrobacterota bacterium]QQS03676.1 MAG: hypothetical protein IPK50_15390 [Fibrobacterota bacterium]
MKTDRFLHVFLTLSILGATSCSKPKQQSLEFYFTKSLDSTIKEKISALENFDSITTNEIDGHLVFSRIFPSKLPLSNTKSIWMIVTIEGTCTPLAPSVFNDLCDANEFREPEEPGDYQRYLEHTLFSPKQRIRKDTIDSIHEIPKYLDMIPDCFQPSTARLGFCNYVSPDWNRSDLYQAFRIQINLENPEPLNWKIDRIGCPASDWLIESDSVYFPSGALALIKSISEKRQPSLLEKNQIREYYLADAINYQRKDFKRLLPGQKELLEWLTAD